MQKKSAPHFPVPVRLSAGCTRWKLSEILKYEAARAGSPPPTIDPSEDRYLSDKEVAERFDVSRASVWRWSSGAAA